MKTSFKNFNSPDLREMSEFVLCKEDLFKKNEFSGFDWKVFKKDSIYKVDKIFGDPQRAIDEFHIKTHVPLECISRVYIKGEDKNSYLFTVSAKYVTYNIKNNFYDFFELMEESNIAKKYNL